MAPPIRSAIGDALSLIKSGDVMAATAAIQQSLGIGGGARAPAGAATEFEARTVNPSANPYATPSAGVLPLALPGPAADTATVPKPRSVPFSKNKAKVNARAVSDRPEENFQALHFQSEYGALDYKLYAPAAPGKRKLALVMMLHGCTQNPDDFARGTRMNGLADEFGLVVVYPHQSRATNPQGCWSWFEARHQKRGSGEPAILASLARQVASSYQITPDRIFVAGLSAGGAMADILVSTYPDVFAAAGIHSGLPHGAASSMASAFGAMKGRQAMQMPSSEMGAKASGVARKIVFHGGADRTVDASNGMQVYNSVGLQRQGGSEMATDRIVNGERVTHTTLDGPDGATLAEHWLVHGAGHAWSGGDGRGSFAESSGPDASREMVRFFLQLTDA